MSEQNIDHEADTVINDGFEDIDTPVDESELYGDPEFSEDIDILKGIAEDDSQPDEDHVDDADSSNDGDSEDGDADEAADVDGDADPEQEASQEDRHPASDKQTIPAARVSEVHGQISAYADQLGIQVDLADPSAMTSAGFSELTAFRNELRTRASIARHRAPESEKAVVEDDAPPAVDLKELRRKWQEANYNGESEEAIEIWEQIHEEERRQIRAESERVSVEAARTQQVAASARNLANQIVQKYPFFAENDSQNQAVEDFVNWRDMYQSKGYGILDAMRMAAEKVVPLYEQQQSATAAASNKSVAEKKQDPRKAAAIKRNAADSDSQPPVMTAGIGNRAVNADMEVASQDDWEKLPASEREKILMG